MIGLIGVGLVGTALATRLLKAGRPVIGFDLDPDRTTQLVQLGGHVARDSAAVFRHADTVVLSLPTSQHVTDVVTRVGPELRAGTLLIDTTTGDPRDTTALGADLATRGVRYLEGTISGSSAQVLDGHAVLMAGGSADDFQAALPLLNLFCHHAFLMGPWGSGAAAKLISNLILGLNRAALAEGLALAERAGLDLTTLLPVLAAGAAGSRAMDAKGLKMITREFAPQARLAQHLKDVDLILDWGRQLGARLPLSGLHRGLLARLAAQGDADLDNSAILKAFLD